MKRLRSLLGIFALLLPLAAAGRSPRLIVLTDMGADPDDEQSLVRLLPYALSRYQRVIVTIQP